MHYDAIFLITRQVIRYYFAKCFWKKPFVNSADRVMNVFFRSAHTALFIPALFSHQIKNEKRSARVAGRTLLNNFFELLGNPELPARTEHIFVYTFVQLL